VKQLEARSSLPALIRPRPRFAAARRPVAVQVPPRRLVPGVDLALGRGGEAVLEQQVVHGADGVCVGEGGAWERVVGVICARDDAIVATRGHGVVDVPEG
jgi:hypothetical protein